MEKLLVNNEYELKRFEGKGGWTYAEIPEILQNGKNPFGWVKVRGKVDDYEFSDFSLMPMGSGRLFFPVKAEIRKKIKKQAGDKVKIVLYADNSTFKIPVEFEECLEMEPAANSAFQNLKGWEQRMLVKQIYSAKRIETRVERITRTIEKLINGERLF